MDKTGTLTKGEPEVTDVIVVGVEADRLLALVAAVERESEHPLAQAIVTEAERRGVPVLRAESFDSVPGHGALATVDGHRVVVGNRRLMDREGVALGDQIGRAAWREGGWPDVEISGVAGRLK